MIEELHDQVRQLRVEEWDTNNNEMNSALRLLSDEQDRLTRQKSLGEAKAIQSFVRKADKCSKPEDKWRLFKSAESSDLPEHCVMYLASTLQKIDINRRYADEKVLATHQEALKKLTSMLEELAAAAKLDAAILVRNAMKEVEIEVTELQRVQDDSEEKSKATVASVRDSMQREIDRVLDVTIPDLEEHMRADAWKRLKNEKSRSKKIELIREFAARASAKNNVAWFRSLTSNLNAIQTIESRFTAELKSVEKTTHDGFTQSLAESLLAWDAQSATYAWLRVNKKPLPGPSFEVEADLPPIPESVKSAFIDFNNSAAKIEKEFDAKAAEIVASLLAAVRTPTQSGRVTVSILAVCENGCLIRMAGQSVSYWHPRNLVWLPGQPDDAKPKFDHGDEWYRAEEYSLGSKYGNQFQIKADDRVFALRGNAWYLARVRESRQDSVRVVWEDLPTENGEVVEANFVRAISEGSIVE